MSKNDMVMVPRERLEDVLSVDVARTVLALDSFRAILDQSARQHQGEPVALPARKKTTSGLLSDSNTHNRGWNACLDEIEKLGPLYTQAEVEPTPECFCVERGPHIEDLKAQLAEAYTLLREIHDGRISGHERWLKIEAALSASAEPSDPADKRTNEDSWNCKYCRNTESCEALKDPRNFGEPSAPVEIDDPCKWSDRQVLDFLGVALRNVDLQGEVRLGEIRQGFEYMRARAALDRQP